MRRERNIKRGEIWLCDLGEERGSIQMTGWDKRLNRRVDSNN